MIRSATICALIALAGCRDTPPVERFATFNIENFPKDARQVAGAFAQMAALGAQVIAVQEISDPALFRREAEARLGATWEFVHLDTSPFARGGNTHHNGVVFDRRAWTLLSWRAHDETRTQGRHKPTLEVRLRSRAGATVRVLVVHLKSGGANADIREQQLAGLVKIVEKSREPTVLLGDFNATGDRDRANLEALARRTRLVWATERLPCSAFWSRSDSCPRSRLDHAFTTWRPSRVVAAGGCATEGCAESASCPLYAEHVSDHCPVVITR